MWENSDPFDLSLTAIAANSRMETGSERIANYVGVCMAWCAVCLHKYRTVVRKYWKIAYLQVDDSLNL